MAYKKYIERNGKIYGPYVYHSRRVNGKVVSEYRGVKQKSKFKKVFFILALLVLVFSFLLWTVLFRSEFAGRVVLDLEQDVSEGFQGNINLVLKEGELMPVDSKIILENGGSSYEYFLKDFVEMEEVFGNYYLEDKEIVGDGEGFGLPGTKEKIVPVFFQLEIKDNVVSGETGEENDSGESGILNNTLGGESVFVEETSEDVVGGIAEESVSGEKTERIFEEVGEEKTEDSVLEEASSNEEVKEKEVSGSGTITGNAIREIGSVFSNVFTGGIVKEDIIIQGDVSKGGEFKENIASGKVVEIVEGSVMTEEGELSLDVLNLDFDSEKVIITTNYSKVEEGFGKEYVGESEMEISIPLHSLNISFVEGPIVVRGVYGELELFSYSGKIKENVSAGEIIISNETLEENGSEINETGVLNVSEENLTFIEENVSIINETLDYDFNLSDEEIFFLTGKFGTTEVKSTVKKYRDKFLVELTIGNFSLKHYYSDSLSQEELKFEIERDKNIWLKDLVREFSKEEIVLEEIIL